MPRRSIPARTSVAEIAARSPLAPKWTAAQRKTAIHRLLSCGAVITMHQKNIIESITCWGPYILYSGHPVCDLDPAGREYGDFFVKYGKWQTPPKGEPGLTYNHAVRLLRLAVGANYPDAYCFTADGRQRFTAGFDPFLRDEHG